MSVQSMHAACDALRKNSLWLCAKMLVAYMGQEESLEAAEATQP